MSVQILGYGATWWRGDPLPTLPPLAGFRVVATDNHPLLANLAQRPVTTIEQRVTANHQPYLALLQDHPVAYGWSATQDAAIDELALAFPIPPGNRYLWDFTTLPDWRGRGMYPRLLQAILRREDTQAQRFWLAMTAENTAAHRAVAKAGFQVVEALVRDATGQVRIRALGATGRATVSPLGLRLGLIRPQREEMDCGWQIR